jgi:aspartate kinase
MTGFRARSSAGEVTHIGRGGSDLTATLIAAALNADSVEIWSDASGVMSADPRIVPNAQTINEISYQNAFELAALGGKILYHQSILPAARKNIPIVIRNTFAESSSGTTISAASENNYASVLGVTEQALLKVTTAEMIGAVGYLAQIFTVVKQHKLSVDLVAVSETSVSFTIAQDDYTAELETELSEAGQLEVETDLAIISIISNQFNDRSFYSKALKALSQLPTDTKLITFNNSKTNLSFVIPEEDKNQTIQTLHKQLVENA